MAELVTPFHLRISESGITSYRVERIDEHGRVKATHSFAAPDSLPEMRSLRPASWPYPILKSDDTSGRLIGYGRTLYDCLFREEIQTEWDMLGEAEEPVHLMVETTSAELAALPWEFLVNESNEPVLYNERVTFSRKHSASRRRDLQQPPGTFRITGVTDDEEEARLYNEMISRALPLLEDKSGPVRVPGKSVLAECREIAETDAGVVLFIGTPDEAAMRVLARSRSLRLIIMIPGKTGEKWKRSVELVPLEEKVPAVVAYHKSAIEGPLLDFTEALVEALGRGLTVTAAVAEARRHCLLLLPNELSTLGIRTWIESDVCAVDLDAARQKRLRQKTRAIHSYKLTEDPRLRALKLGRFANMLRDSGEIERAIETYREAIEAFGDARDPYNEAVALNQLGTLLTYRNRFAEAISPLERAIDIRKKMGTLPEAEMSINRLAYTASALGDYEKALACYREAADLNRSLMRREPLANVLLRMGGVFRKLENTKDAEKTLRECISISRDVPNPSGILVDAYSHLGAILMSEKRYDEAEEVFRSCTALADTLGNREEIALAQNNLGNILQRRGEFEEARNSYRKGLEIFNALALETGVASSLHNLAVVEEKLNNAEDAIRTAFQAREIAKKLGNSTLVEVVSRQLDRMKTTFGPDLFKKIYNAAMDSTRRIDRDFYTK